MGWVFDGSFFLVVLDLLVECGVVCDVDEGVSSGLGMEGGVSWRVEVDGVFRFLREESSSGKCISL